MNRNQGNSNLGKVCRFLCCCFCQRQPMDGNEYSSILISTSEESVQGGNMILFHATNIEAGESIMESKIMKPGESGRYGAGIYFAESEEICKRKTANGKDYLITALVKMGRCLRITANDQYDITYKWLKSKGYDSVIGGPIPTSLEYIVYRSEDVIVLFGKDIRSLSPNNLENYLKSQKILFNGMNPGPEGMLLPQSNASINGGNIILFHATNLKAGESIMNSRVMKPGKKGRYGAGIYFAESEEICRRKTAQGADYLITALVMMGKCLRVTANKQSTITYEWLKEQGYDSVIGGPYSNSLEYIVYRSQDVIVLSGKDIRGISFNDLHDYMKSQQETYNIFINVNIINPILIQGERNIQKQVRILFHATNTQAGESIMNSRKMIPGRGGLFGPGIYFAKTQAICEYRALHGSNYLITALVYLGFSLRIKSGHIPEYRNFSYQNLKMSGYDSVIAGQKRRKEFVVYLSENVVVLDGKMIGNMSQVDFKNWLAFQLESYNHTLPIPTEIYYPSDSNLPDPEKEKRILFHVTNLEAGESIMKDKKMLPGKGGLYGPAIYFAKTEWICNNRSLNGKEFLIIAEVTLGRSKRIFAHKEEYRQFSYQKLEIMGYHSVIAGKKEWKEFVVYRPEDVNVLKGKQIKKYDNSELREFLNKHAKKNSTTLSDFDEEIKENTGKIEPKKPMTYNTLVFNEEAKNTNDNHPLGNNSLLTNPKKNLEEERKNIEQKNIENDDKLGNNGLLTNSEKKSETDDNGNQRVNYVLLNNLEEKPDQENNNESPLYKGNENISQIISPARDENISTKDNTEKKSDNNDNNDVLIHDNIPTKYSQIISPPKNRNNSHTNDKNDVLPYDKSGEISPLIVSERELFSDNNEKSPYKKSFPSSPSKKEKDNIPGNNEESSHKESFPSSPTKQEEDNLSPSNSKANSFNFFENKKVPHNPDKNDPKNIENNGEILNLFKELEECSSKLKEFARDLKRMKKQRKANKPGIGGKVDLKQKDPDWKLGEKIKKNEIYSLFFKLSEQASLLKEVFSKKKIQIQIKSKFSKN